ncbi:UNVERIFIED_CONTAM: hypothetical protein RMT77_005908 [Armadillidium vulgare]
MASPLKYFQIRNGSRILHQTTINITNVSRLGSSSNPVSAFSEEFRNAKPISEMPGLNTYSAIKDFLLAKLTNTKSPVEFDSRSVFNFWINMKKVYGPTFQLNLIGQLKFVFITDPVDVERFYEITNHNPVRKGLLSLKKVRDEAEDNFFEKKGGIATENYDEWRRVRSRVQAPVLRPKNIVKYIKQMDSVARDFTDRIAELQQKYGEMPSNFQQEIYKFALESIGTVAINKRLGCLKTNLPSDSVQVKLINSVNTVFEMLNVAEVGIPWWKYIPSPSYNKLKESHDFVFSVVHPRIVEVEKELERKIKEGDESDHDLSLLETLLQTDGLTRKDVITFMLDLFMGGIDTTSHSLGFSLYLLARNKDKQKKLQEELDLVLGDGNGPLTEEHLAKLSYLKACLKESQRLFPLVPGNLRTLEKDTVIGGYVVPKGHNVLALNIVTARDDENFKQSKEFIPERWMRERPLGPFHPYSSLPFSTGIRMCIGRRIAEQEMYIFLARVLHRFNIDYKYEDISMAWRLVAIPSEPLRFQFTERRTQK